MSYKHLSLAVVSIFAGVSCSAGYALNFAESSLEKLVTGAKQKNANCWSNDIPNEDSLRSVLETYLFELRASKKSEKYNFSGWQKSLLEAFRTGQLKNSETRLHVKNALAARLRLAKFATERTVGEIDNKLDGYSDVPLPERNQEPENSSHKGGIKNYSLRGIGDYAPNKAPMVRPDG